MPAADPRAHVVGLPPQSLRQRKKAATMRRIQQCAVDLFEAEGFEKVTIEQVAEAADVSASTVYRYFGTKERLVLHDEHDEVLLDLLPTLLTGSDLMTAVERAVDLMTPEHTDDPNNLSTRRVRLWFDVPEIQAAAGLVVDEIIDSVAAGIAARPQMGLTESQARVVMSAIGAVIVAAIRNWHAAGGSEAELLPEIRDALAVARRTLGTPPATVEP